jgi:beta-mannosidase
MHYWFMNHMFVDVMSACGYVGRSHNFVCYVSNARSDSSFDGTLTLSAIDLVSGSTSVWASLPVTVAPGPGALSWVSPNATLPNASTTLLYASLTSSNGTDFDGHVVHLTAPSNLVVKRAALSATTAPQPNADGSVNIVVTSDAVALFVTLTCAAPGRFSDNAFLLLPSQPRTLLWVPFVPGNITADFALVNASLRVEDHSAYAPLL